MINDMKEGIRQIERVMERLWMESQSHDNRMLAVVREGDEKSRGNQR
jgi:hypothetical protein